MSSAKGEGPGDAKTAWRYRQYLAAFIVNIISIAAGTAYGWLAPMLPVLQSDNSPLGIPPISDVEASWIASIATLSRLVSIPAYMYAHDRLGRKMTAYLTAIPFIASWVLLLSANSAVLLLLARFFFGVASAGTCLLGPSYVSDVAEDDIKGRLGTFYVLMLDVGSIISYTMGYYVSYSIFNAFCLCLPIIFAASMFWMPESPVFLMTEGKPEEARKALRWLRNGQESEFEMDRIRDRAEDTLKKRNAKISLSDITERSAIRGILINLGLISVRYLCGISAIVSYTVALLQEAGSSISPNVGTIISGVLFAAGTLFSTFVVEKFGRRPLLIWSTVLMAGSLGILGTYFYLKSLGWDLQSTGWVPLFALCLFNFLTGVAIAPLPSAIVTETVSVHARGAVQSLCNIAGSLMSFAVLMSYTPLINVVGHHGCFWLYAGVCAVGAVGIFLTVPETKNRSLEEVLEQLRSDHYISSVLRKDTQLSDRLDKVTS